MLPFLSPMNRLPSLLTLVLCLFTPYLLSAQQPTISAAVECGSFSKNRNALEGSSLIPDSVASYFDRFGNVYSVAEVSVALQRNTSQLGCSNNGYFYLTMEGPFTPEEATTICGVFNYLSILIPAPTPNAHTSIHIVKEIFIDQQTGGIDDQVAGIASPFFSKWDCGITNTAAWSSLYGLSNDGVLQGYIRLNENLAWHTFDPANPGTDNVPPDKIDLYSVVLHEALHVLGIASAVNTGVDTNGTTIGVPIIGNVFTRWDTYLYAELNNHFLLRPMATDPQCCDQHAFDNEHIKLPDDLAHQCASNIFFRTNGVNLAEINGLPGQNTVNILSHIPDACNGGKHVMNPFVLPGEQRRIPQSDEMAILCSLGYPTVNTCTQQPCSLQAKADDLVVMVQGGPRVFHKNELLLNDLFPVNAAFEFDMLCGNIPGSAFQIMGDSVIVQTDSLLLGAYHFCYRIVGCAGQCDEAAVSFLLYQTEENECCQQAIGCNINCLGDMESYVSNADMRWSLCQCASSQESSCMYHVVPGNFVNSPDLVSSSVLNGVCNAPPAIVQVASDQNMLFLAVANLGNKFWESVAFPLCESILPGDEVMVQFLASKSCPNYNMKARIEFTEKVPVASQVVYDNPGIAGGPIWVPLVSSYFDHPQFSLHQSTPIVNNSAQPWNYLLLSPDADVPTGVLLGSFYDEIEALITRNFTSRYSVLPGVSTNTPCLTGLITIDYAVNNTTADQMHALSFNVIVPPGLTWIPSTDFPQQTITMPEGWLMPGACQHLLLTVQVDDQSALLGQTLTIMLTATGASAGCWAPERYYTEIKPIENPLSIATAYIDDTITHVLTFTLTVSNSYSAAISNVEVKNMVASAFTIVDPETFIQSGNALTQMISVPANGQVMLSFTAKRNCFCSIVQNCGIARILEGGCGDQMSCLEIPGILSPPDANFTWIEHPIDCHSIAFAAQSNTPCNEYWWDFGDGYTSDAVNPIHSFELDQSYSVKLSVTNACGATSTMATLSVSCAPPPNFTCPCTGPGDLNIDGGEASLDPTQAITPLSVQSTVLSGGQLLENHYNNVGKCIAIKGDLVIDHQFELYIDGGEIRMQPGSKIIVSSGANLVMNAIKDGPPTDPTSHGIHGCSQMWRGIVMEPGGHLSLTDDIIQDAEYAVEIVGQMNNAPSFVASATDFDRNHVGIRVVKQVHQPFALTNNQFRATTNLLPPFSNNLPHWNATSPYAGIELVRTSFIVGSPGNGAPGNQFTGLRNGIVAYKSDIQVYHGRFKDMRGSNGMNQEPDWAHLEGIGIAVQGQSLTVHDAVFEGIMNNGWRAISATSSKLEAKRNVMNNLQSGIFVTPGAATSVLITENKFRVTLGSWGFAQAAFVINGPAPYASLQIINNDSIQIRGFGPGIWLLNNGMVDNPDLRRIAGNHIFRLEPGSAGILVDSSSRWTLEGNSVVCSGFSQVPGMSGLTRGIQLNAADYCLLKDNMVLASDGNESSANMHAIELAESDHCTLCCNTTDNSRYGFYFTGVCAPTYLRHNRILDHQVGLMCDGTGTVIGHQDWGGNQWLGTYGEMGAAHTGSASDIAASKFYIEAPQSAEFWPASYYPSGANVWFGALAGNSYDCNQDDPLCTPTVPSVGEKLPDLSEQRTPIAVNKYAGNGGLSTQQIHIMPNPVQNTFVVTVEGVALGQVLTMQVFNARGSLETENVITNGDLNTVVLSPGLYLCRIFMNTVALGVAQLLIVQ